MWDTLALATLEEAIGHRFEDRAPLERALTHRSWIEERYPGGRAPAHLSQQRYKTSLPEPDYAPSGPDHKREWTATLTVVGGQGVGSGVKKQDAKREACRSLLSSGAL